MMRNAILSALSAIVGLLALAVGTAGGQTLQSETTWGGAGRDFPSGLAVALDGSSYLAGTTDSFAGLNETRLFLVKFAPDGSLAWQRIWNSPDSSGAAVAVANDGSVYVTGLSSDIDDGNAVLLKFSPAGALIWERVWGGTGAEGGSAVAIDAVDGSVYIGGRTTSFPPDSAGLFVVKFNDAGTLQWQKVWGNIRSGDGVTVAPDGSVYAAATSPRPGGGLDVQNLEALKITPGGSLEWARTYQAGQVIGANGVAAAPDSGSIAIVGSVDSAGLLLKIDANGDLVFDRAYDGGGASGVSVGQDGSIYMSGTTSSFGAGSEDAFVVRVQADGKPGNAATWGATANFGFENGAGVGVTSDGTVVLGASTQRPPPYTLLEAPGKLSKAKGTLSPVARALNDATGVVMDPAAGVTTPNGDTVFSGNVDAALIRFRF
jgi:hypothetical protein